MALYTPEYKPNGKEIAVITTDEGTIRVQLHGEDAPIHVGNFVELAQKGFYDGLKFHRYVPGFVIQGGCPNTREATPEQVAAGRAPGMAPFGTGNPGYSIKEEFTTNPNNSHEDGALAMARSMDPNSAGSQFFIMHQDAPHLDKQYAAFGQVLSGMEVVDAICQVKTDRNDRPETEQKMKSVRVDTKGETYPEPKKLKDPYGRF